MKFTIDYEHKEEYRGPNGDLPPSLISKGSVHVVDDSYAESEKGYAFIHDADGNAVAWYAGCGTHQLVITRSFHDWLTREGS